MNIDRFGVNWVELLVVNVDIGEFHSKPTRQPARHRFCGCAAYPAV